MAEDIPFAEKIKTIQVMNRTGAGPRVRDVRLPTGEKAKEIRQGDPDQEGYVTTTESGTERADVVVQPNTVRLSAQMGLSKE